LVRGHLHLLFRQQNVLGVYEWKLLDRVEETGGFQIQNPRLGFFSFWFALSFFARGRGRSVVGLCRDGAAAAAAAWNQEMK
jgi:hypothetical protein